MGLARLKGQTQGLARPQQMLLADYLIGRTGPQLLGQRCTGIHSPLGKQITQNESDPAETPS
jgi:hypothetical protein